MKKYLAAKNGFSLFRLLLSILFLAGACMLGVLGFAAPARALQSGHGPGQPDATPGSGTLSLANPSLTYTGGPFVIPNPTAQAGDPICNLPMSCDDFALTVDATGVTPGTKRVKISVAWPVATADFDVYVLDAGATATVATAASSADPEVVFLPATSTGYTIRTIPFAPAGQSYTATVTLEDVPPSPPPGSGIPQRFQNYPAPDGLAGAGSAGEPSIGIDWNINCAATVAGCENLHPNAQFPKRNTGGVAFYTANLNEYRVTFDDCASPARNLWEDKTSPLTGAQTLDPIGFVDHDTGRIFQSQLAAVTSVTVYSDDDGETWTPSQGAGIPAGVDHQTLGGGPYNPNAVPPPVPLTAYPNTVYYASQDIATAFAARSDDGGLTFGPGIPMYLLTQCGGLHGHIKVGPDGTVYLPNKSCGGEQGVVVSTDNGLTWTVRTVPGSTSGDTDPSVGIGADNTVYLGYQNADGHPHIAVSTDKGVTWNDVDVSQGVVQNCVFPEVIAGDGDRAAFGFLGTTTGGGYQDTNNFRGVWHFYVATTLDRGQTYTLVNATKNDPVQIGSICTGGTTCGGDRNLLDFNDIQVDREGRVMAAYADGCVAPACTEGTATAHAPPYNESRSALSSIIRQSGGPRLFAAFDPAEPHAPEPPRVDSVVRTATQIVHLDWSEPDNGGSPLTGYKVYRKTGVGGTYALLATVTLGCPSCKTDYDDATANMAATDYFYKVTALNALGESANCGDFPVGEAAAVGDKCVLPGVQILSDDAGDIVTPVGVSAMPSWDVRSLSIAEPFVFAPNKLAFTLKVESLSPLPPETTWPVEFDSNGNRYLVRMSTAAINGGTAVTPVFQYGPVAGPFVAADAASTYSADGTITIIVPTSGIGNPQPGQTISGFLTRIAATVVAVSITPDNMPDNLGPAGSYTLVGNASCAPNAAPIAALAGAPLTGTAPVQVNFDASASSDPDSGDTIASYTFNFGDGSPEVTQASPMISHTYADSGAFQASVRVTDSRGASSTNPTSVVVQVGSTLTGVVSRKTHGAAGDFDIALPGVECRNAANNSHLVVFTFQRNLTAVTSSTVSEGTASKGSEGIGPAPNQYFVTLTGVANAQYVTVTLDGVQDTAGTNLTGVYGRMAVLNGDVTANLVTNSSDVAQAKAQSGQTTDAGNYRLDVNANGMINSSDVSQIKTNSGTSVSAPARGSANVSRK